MRLNWRRYPEGCNFLTGKAWVVAAVSTDTLMREMNHQLSPQLFKLALTSPGPTKELESLVRREFREPYVECPGLNPLSDVDCIRGRGKPELYMYNSPDPEDDKACRISFDLANIEPSPGGIEKFMIKWGPPTAGLVTEREFRDVRQQVRFILQSSIVQQHDYLEDRRNLQERIFKTYRGAMFAPTTPFECAVRELHALAEYGTLRQIRECQECKDFYIANKRTAYRTGTGPGAPQRFCRDCGRKARAKAQRLRSKMRGAAGHTGKKVTADPSYAKPSSR
jgi:hypothetical protein